MSAPTSSSSESPQLCRHFTFSEIQLATQNLDESLVIGRGGFGKVYKGTITNGPNILTVAIKRLDSTSTQGASEFWAEVNMLSNLRHCHLVSFIGYCNDGLEMILVYEYMPNGTLEDHLHKRQTPLSWVQRLTICIGAARSLDYLHMGTGIKHGVVHRDVKSSNILLDDSWEAKISDFGLSKICPKNRQTTYVNTGIKGTFGYLDPDYFYTGKLTRKSDVYAFGVVLFEVLCGKRAVDRRIHEEHWGLAVWAQESIKEGRLKQIVDTSIRGSVSPKCLKEFAQLAKQCLHKDPKQRPTMAKVVVGLESTLALQEKANNTLQPTSMNFFARLAPKVIFPSFENSGGRSLKSLELYFNTVGGENQTLHRFDINTLIVATENFSEAHNKITHTFDPLYKGKLQNGQSIAVLRTPPLLDMESENKYMNEALILVKLEHENVAKLLGYCIEGTVYPERTLSNWDKQYKVILGVARALLYLHRDAPVTVIHFNVEPGSILLDESLNPILSSFWYARCLASMEVDCNTCILRGTWRYMAPEYLLHGYLSIKTDVYGFGVLVLELIAGCRVHLLTEDTADPYESLEYVVRNWFEGTVSNVIYPKIDVDSSFMTSFLEIGLLCVQKDANDRPTMEEVVSMLLDSSSLTLPIAKMRERITRERSNSVSSSNTVDNSDPDYDYNTGPDEDFILELVPR
ncbi:putative protein kinase RLK-Pelle-CrRLK1L-1 family [Helianthus debilis subsp. tardiflorus]